MVTQNFQAVARQFDCAVAGSEIRTEQEEALASRQILQRLELQLNDIGTEGVGRPAEAGWRHGRSTLA
jgi:hypothetical protein